MEVFALSKKDLEKLRKKGIKENLSKTLEKKIKDIIKTINIMRDNSGRKEDYELFLIEQLFREILRRGSIEEAVEYIDKQKKNNFSSLRAIWLYERVKKGDKKAEEELEWRKQLSKSYGWSG